MTPLPNTASATADPRQVSSRVRLAMGLGARVAVLLGIVAALAGAIRSPSSTAFATHTLSTPTPYLPMQVTVGPYGPSPSNPWISTPTPTPFGYGPYQPPQGQTPYTGAPNPPYPGAAHSTYPGTSGQPYPGGPNPTYPGMSGQPYPGAPTPTHPTVPGQQSVPAPPYVGAPGSGIAPSGSGIAGGAIVPSGASPVPSGADPCYGDEVITYSPELPRIGNEFLVAVTSSRPHPYGRLAGTEPTRFVRERPGQRGFVWEWTVQPSYPGLHEYTFYVDSTVVCQKVQLRVLQSLSTRTPTPTKVPTPYGFDNGNSNNNSNNNNNSNDNFNSNNNFNNGPFFGFTPTPTVFNPNSYLGQGDRYGCLDFASQANAQAVLRADPSDPNRLDTNPRDGFACVGAEAAQDGVAGGVMPLPSDGTRVPRP
jgi:hypothetical protein